MDGWKADIDCLGKNRQHGIVMGETLVQVYGAVAKLFRITACHGQKHTCASDFQTLNTIKHFIVNLKKTIVN